MIKVDLKKRKSAVKSAVIGWAAIVSISIMMAGCGKLPGWPVPSEAGAMLYVGSSTSIPNIGSLEVGFILSADKTKISNLTVIVKNLKYSLLQKTGWIKWSKTSYMAVNAVQSPATDIIFDESLILQEYQSSLTGLTFTDDGAQAEVKYVYIENSSDGERIIIPFPSTNMTFVRIEN
jgi:hypothetical protein